MLIAKPEQIIENSNGKAFKFSGGTMICVKKLSIPQGSSSLTVEFAEDFINAPVVLVTNIFSYNRGIIWSVGDPTNSTADVYAHFSAGPPGGSADAFLIAIGRWK